MKPWHCIFLSTSLNSPQLWKEKETYDRLLILFFFVVAAIKKIHQKLFEGFGGGLKFSACWSNMITSSNLLFPLLV